MVDHIPQPRTRIKSIGTCEWCGEAETLNDKEPVQSFQNGTFFHKSCKITFDKWNMLRAFLRQAGWNRAEFRDFVELMTDELPEEAQVCIHPGVFARGPVPGTEHCWSCGRDVPREEL